MRPRVAVSFVFFHPREFVSITNLKQTTDDDYNSATNECAARNIELEFAFLCSEMNLEDVPVVLKEVPWNEDNEKKERGN